MKRNDSDLQLSPETLAALQEHYKTSHTDKTAPTPNEEDPNTISLSENNCKFKRLDYWNKRFEEEKTYEWLLSFDQLKTLLLPIFNSYHNRDISILVIGCGNSNFSSDLYDAGWQNITNIDFSEVCIMNMRKSNELRYLMSWKVMDMTSLDGFDKEAFDIVIDKGSMDALMVDEGDVWDPSTEVIRVTDQMCLNISRVLKSGGNYVQISFSQPHFRSKYLMAFRVPGSTPSLQQPSPYVTYQGLCQRYGWKLSFQSIILETGCINHFLYVMTK